MQGTNVLFGQIAVVFGIVIAGVWSATQWTAAALGYQVRLGTPWFDFFGTPVYHPWANPCRSQSKRDAQHGRSAGKRM
ncbi:hypothetical protein [Parapusillimonas granuli]|uniref:Uncharacterized protein n=1 Tax=Parapusillimonas granuli TaxID=380911 RepID=A0A853G8J8_9BURK|nr:hypothetical protein [Parapusillimonas granuli]MBB5217505.1 type IV secretory pathway TraG/TraD family ATPase VirD4 [Parapusillimonas granuli]NYT51270.1 hypothetical protein [Parapusillimonas granuli]NYT80283.1 hypothetical protein [Alcaligenaceae bacterium]